MAIQTLNGIPVSFTAGDTVLFTESFADFPSPTWTANLWLSLNGTTPTSFTATQSGTGFLFTLPATGTALTPGEYRYSQKVTDGTSVATAKEGTIWVLPDYMNAQSQTTAQRMLAALEDAIVKLTSKQFKTTSFNGQTNTINDLPQMFRERVRLQAEVAREQAAFDRLRGGPDRGRVGFKFVSSTLAPPFPQYPFPR